VSFSTFIGQQYPWGELEQFGGVGTRHLGKLIDAYLEIRRPSTDRRTAAKHGDVEGR
jgi:hypothetical protein